MSQLWFTADLHLGHGNIIRYCDRPFLSDAEKVRVAENRRGNWKVSDETIRAHDDAIIEAINARVGEEDRLWILGDFSLSPFEEAKQYRDRIRCRDVNLVRGNHDLPSYDSLFRESIDQGMIKHRGQRIWLNHYPMRAWDKAYHGAWHLYGHVHGRLLEEDAATPRLLVRDVGVDVNDFAPISFPELAEYMAPREIAFQEWKASLPD